VMSRYAPDFGFQGFGTLITGIGDCPERLDTMECASEDNK